MIKCPSCANIYDSASGVCQFCGQKPRVENEITMWSPDFTGTSEGFKSEYFNTLAKLEETSFWFQARNELILWSLRRYFEGFNSFMEIGCGTGFVLQSVARNYPSATLAGSEVFTNGLKYAKSRTPGANFVQMDARNIPYIEEYDVIGIFDVLEHIEKDHEVISGIFNALKPRGGLIVTVPQHPGLWSKADEYACHVRRYTHAEIFAKLELAGFRIIRSTSFVSLLLPVLAVSRLMKDNSEQYDPLAEYTISTALSKILKMIMKVELLMIQAGISFPAGGSRLVIARKV